MVGACARWMAVLVFAGAIQAWAEPPEECPPIEAGLHTEGAGALPPGESPSVLLVLPKNAEGELSTEGLELGPGARIAESRFSPLLCATIARIAGAPGADPRALVVRLPADAAVVLDDFYEAGAGDATAPAPAAGRGGDPYRAAQYALDLLGVDAARAVSRGAGARVAILDSGPQIGHPDLAAVKLAPGAEAGAPARHGTLVAGVVAATPDNGLGIAGLAPDASVLAFPVCASARNPADPDLCRLYGMLAGLDSAWAQRAQVVNLSLVGPANAALERAVRRLDTLGVGVVAAAGNRAGAGPAYPAAYAWVIGVGATDAKGKPAESGPVVDLTAPGVDIVSTVPGGDFAFASGSSLAAAHVSGALALLVSASDGDVSAARRALFLAARSGRAPSAAPPPLAPLCDSLARLGRPCAPIKRR